MVLDKEVMRGKNTVKRWDYIYAKKQQWRTWAYIMALNALPSTFVPSSIFDVGCGMGDGLLACKEKWDKARLLGLDFSKVAIKKAKERLPNTVFSTEDFLVVNKLSFAADLVLCCETLEHVQHPARLEKMIVASASNVVVVTVPYEGKMYPNSRGHLSSFTKEWFVSRGYKVGLCKHPKKKEKVIVAVLNIT